jgi:hypothetical protein
LTSDGTVSGIVAEPGLTFDGINLSVSGSIHLSGSIATASYIDYINNTAVPSYLEGRTFYDSNTGALAYYTSATGVQVEIGQQMYVRVKNDEATEITKGTPVRFFSAQGEVPTVLRANATTDQTRSVYIVGLAAHNIAAGAVGFVISQGVLQGVDTSGFTTGQPLFVGSSSGSLTTTRPAPPTSSILAGGAIKIDAVDGDIYVYPANPSFVSSLSNVSSSIIPSNNDILVYRTGSSTWINTKSGLDLGGSFSGSFTGTYSGSSILIVSASCGSFISASFSPLVPSAQVNKGGIPGSRGGLRNPALPNALTLNACVADGFHPRNYFGVEQNYWAQRVISGSEDAGWNNKTRPVGKQQYYWEDTGSYLSSYRNYLSANDLLAATPDELERIYQIGRAHV